VQVISYLIKWRTHILFNSNFRISNTAVFSPGEDVTGGCQRGGVDATEREEADVTKVRVGAGYKGGWLVTEAEATAVTLAPHPGAAVDEQRGMEKPAGDPYLQAGCLLCCGKATRCGSKARFWFWKQKVGDGGGIQAALLLPAAELAGRAAAPREEGERIGSAWVEGRGGVRGGRSGKATAGEGEEAAEHCRRRRRVCLVADDEAASCEHDGS
jgi:hypothetical protein